jgi:hypothetical protein
MQPAMRVSVRAKVRYNYSYRLHPILGANAHQAYPRRQAYSAACDHPVHSGLEIELPTGEWHPLDATFISVLIVVGPSLMCSHRCGTHYSDPAVLLQLLQQLQQLQ